MKQYRGRVLGRYGRGQMFRDPKYRIPRVYHLTEVGNGRVRFVGSGVMQAVEALCEALYD